MAKTLISIRIDATLKTKLDKLKVIPMESYNSVIERLLNSHEMLTYKG